MFLKPALVSAAALACCAPLFLPFSLPLALFRSQEFVALWLHSWTAQWSRCSFWRFLQDEQQLVQNWSLSERPIQKGQRAEIRVFSWDRARQGAAGAPVLLGRTGRVVATVVRALLQGWAAQGHGLCVCTWWGLKEVIPAHGCGSRTDLSYKATALLPWWIAIPVSWCIGIILCRTKSVQFIIARPIFFLFPLQWSINDLNKSYSFGTCNARNAFPVLYQDLSLGACCEHTFLSSQ